ncbi:hypothetical protein KAI23_01190, partial [Candidatus Bathyarchaeota archaeon]|nr:hypothetical protein [Candidatus Bathyarchaeota archaeon]
LVGRSHQVTLDQGHFWNHHSLLYLDSPPGKFGVLDRYPNYKIHNYQLSQAKNFIISFKQK